MELYSSSPLSGPMRMMLPQFSRNMVTIVGRMEGSVMYQIILTRVQPSMRAAS